MIRWPGASRGKELLSEKDRQLYQFAMENIVEELLVPYRNVVFRDPMGLLVILIWEPVPDSLWEQMNQAILMYLKIATVFSYTPVIGNHSSISLTYHQAKFEVYKESKLSPFIRTAKEIIGRRFHESALSLEGVASELNVSPVYLSRTFKQETGISFVSQLTQTRIKQAIRLITTTDLPMVLIAEQVGYDSQHYFSTAFKKVVGLPPNQYRKEGTGV
ncbi:helix-turn-helix transcriptional regulator [Paenibacillus hexagrammi]|uniref:helix-turn-helix transcriptional regulator n=1 Tax=Paenibacillus hexagrammi TaxID=2908839 RepID=UPI002882E397|nr:helix-turn-helix transcriptional regulator [Paenibacillus sp. YPD9-1]